MLVQEGVEVWRQDGVGEEGSGHPGGGHRHRDEGGAGRARDRGDAGTGDGEGRVTRELQRRRRGIASDGDSVTRTGAPPMMEEGGLLIFDIRAGISREDRVDAELQHRLEGGDPGHHRGRGGGGALTGGGRGRGGLDDALLLSSTLRSLLGLPGELEELRGGARVVETGPEQGRRGRGAQASGGGGVTGGRGRQVTKILGKHPKTGKHTAGRSSGLRRLLTFDLSYCSDRYHFTVFICHVCYHS